MSVLGLDSVYTAKYGLNPWEFPQAVPSGTPLGSGLILPYIPRLVLIRIQNTLFRTLKLKYVFTVLGQGNCEDAFP